MTPTVPIFVTIEGVPGEQEDMEVPGIYQIDVDATLSEADRASAALDVLHSKIGIAQIDDFTFTVRSQQGKVLTESETRQGYGLSSRGTFEGRVTALPEPEIDDLLEAVEAVYNTADDEGCDGLIVVGRNELIALLDMARIDHRFGVALTDEDEAGFAP